MNGYDWQRGDGQTGLGYWPCEVTYCRFVVIELFGFWFLLIYFRCKLTTLSVKATKNLEKLTFCFI